MDKSKWQTWKQQRTTALRRTPATGDLVWRHRPRARSTQHRALKFKKNKPKRRVWNSPQRRSNKPRPVGTQISDASCSRGAAAACSRVCPWALGTFTRQFTSIRGNNLQSQACTSESRRLFSSPQPGAQERRFASLTMATVVAKLRCAEKKYWW